MEQAELSRWLEGEIQSRLLAIEEKLDDRCLVRDKLEAIELKIDDLASKVGGQLVPFRSRPITSPSPTRAMPDEGVSPSSDEALPTDCSLQKGDHMEEAATLDNTELFGFDLNPESTSEKKKALPPSCRGVVNIEASLPIVANSPASSEALSGDAVRPMPVAAESGHKTSFFSGTGSASLSPILCTSENDKTGLAAKGAGMVRRFSVGMGLGEPEILQRRRHRSAKAESVWTFLDDPESSTYAGVWANVMPTVAVMTVFWTLAQVTEPPFLSGAVAAYGETSFDVIFVLEVLVRFAVCPSRCMFFVDLHNVTDIIAAVPPLVVRAYCGFLLPGGRDISKNFAHSFLLCLVPVLRLMKTLRRFQQFKLLLSAFEHALEALPVLIFTLLVIMLIFAALIFIAEPADNIGTLPEAMWLTIVTMTTVGYGEVVPVSPPGYCIVGVLVICSVLFMAMPLGIIGQAFNETWKDRDRILLMQRTRDRLLQWGYTAHDIPVLFQHFDGDGSGELDLPEFRKMIRQMKIGLKDHRIVELFGQFDADGSGSVDDEEFVKILFPETYHELYVGNAKDSMFEDSDSESSNNDDQKSSSSGRMSAAKRASDQDDQRSSDQRSSSSGRQSGRRSSSKEKRRGSLGSRASRHSQKRRGSVGSQGSLQSSNSAASGEKPTSGSEASAKSSNPGLTSCDVTKFSFDRPPRGHLKPDAPIRQTSPS